MGRDRAGAGIEAALQKIDDWVEQSAQVTRRVELQAEAERRGSTTDDDRGQKHRR